MAGKYIVMFKEGTQKKIIDEAISAIEAQGGVVTHRYDSSAGFAAEIPDNHLNTLTAHEHIDIIEADGTVSAFASSLGIK